MFIGSVYYYYWGSVCGYYRTIEVVYTDSAYTKVSLRC